MKILITGGSGLVGSKLTNHLIENGHEVRILSRTKFRHLNASVYEWKPDQNYIEEGALDGIEAIVNLAGAGVADRRWTIDRKSEMIDSRVDSAICLFYNLSENSIQPKVIVNASAIGYYGYGEPEKLFSEDDPTSSDFLAQVCVKWETAADKLESVTDRLVKVRIGVVLDDKGGALTKIKQPIQLFAGAPLGSGKQMMSWIHNEDMSRIIEYAIENERLTGTYNAVSDSPVNNKEFTQNVAKVIKRPLFLPNVPAFVMKLMLGEMSEIVLKGSAISNQKIKETGFKFKFTDLQSALEDLL